MALPLTMLNKTKPYIPQIEKLASSEILGGEVLGDARLTECLHLNGNLPLRKYKCSYQEHMLPKRNKFESL